MEEFLSVHENMLSWALTSSGGERGVGTYKFRRSSGRDTSEYIGGQKRQRAEEEGKGARLDG